MLVMEGKSWFKSNFYLFFLICVGFVDNCTFISLNIRLNGNAPLNLNIIFKRLFSFLIFSSFFYLSHVTIHTSNKSFNKNISSIDNYLIALLLWEKSSIKNINSFDKYLIYVITLKRLQYE